VQGLSAARALVDNWPAKAGSVDVFVLEARGRSGAWVVRAARERLLAAVQPMAHAWRVLSC
jgi:hypothetical protein